MSAVLPLRPPLAPMLAQLTRELPVDQVDAYRLRHPARFRRWRPDRDAHDCRLEQLGQPRASLQELLA